MIAETRLEPRTPTAAMDPATVLDGLSSGRLRAAWPDGAVPGGWRVEPAVKAAILARFADRRTSEWAVGPFRYRDRAGLPLANLGEGDQRIVPGGTSVREGAYLGPGVVIMPPSFVNVGAWIGAGAMVDSHVLVGTCAQIGARVHLAAGVQIGGVVEPPGARPVIIEDEAFVGAGSLLLDGVLVGQRAVIAAGVTLTGTSRVYDLVRRTVLEGSPDAPLAIPARSVVVPGTRAVTGGFAAAHGLGLLTSLIVKERDAGTDARVALEEALR